MAVKENLAGHRARSNEIDVLFTFTDDEYLDAGRNIQKIKDATGIHSNTGAVLKALEIASTMSPSNQEEGSQ